MIAIIIIIRKKLYMIMMITWPLMMILFFFYKENLYRITENNSSKKKVKLDCDWILSIVKVELFSILSCLCFSHLMMLLLYLIYCLIDQTIYIYIYCVTSPPVATKTKKAKPFIMTIHIYINICKHIPCRINNKE